MGLAALHGVGVVQRDLKQGLLPAVRGLIDYWASEFATL